MRILSAAGLTLALVLQCFPVAAAPPASAFAALPEMSMVRLSPNGQRVAWANDPGGAPLVVVFDLATGKDLRHLRPSNSRVRDIDWADDRTLIISVSGYAALAGVAFTPDLYACAASVNGIADIPQLAGFIRERGGDDSRAYRSFRDLIGNPGDQDLIAFSPSQAIETIRAPILLIHAENDTVVPPSQSRNFAHLLTQKGKDHQLIELPGEDHWLSTGASRMKVLQALETFLAEYLR